jgi:hypothetical protein
LAKRNRGGSLQDRQNPLQSEPDEQFFHRKHVVAVFWALIAALLTFVATTVWQSAQGPQRVYVTNQDTTVRIAVGRDTALLNRIDELSTDLRALRNNSTREPPILIDGPNGLPATNPIQSPIFRVPSTVIGYLAANLGTLATGGCPRGPFRPGGEIPVRARLKNGGTVAQLSPFIVSITHRQSEHVVNLVWEAQFEARSDNFVLAPAPRDTGTYELTAGFYLRPELDTKYPPFYRSVCPVRVAS